MLWENPIFIKCPFEFLEYLGVRKSDVIEVLVNAMHFGRLPYRWHFNIMDIFPYA